jgi:CheY-like chemotaxis protein
MSRSDLGGWGLAPDLAAQPSSVPEQVPGGGSLQGWQSARILRGVTVLILEDHADTRESFAAGLRQEGAEVITAATAQAALLQFEQQRPDAMVVDIELPDVDGWDFLEAVRRLEGGRSVPGIAVSCHNEREDRHRSILAGFRLHVPKPLDAPRLARIVAGVLTHFADQ